MAKKRSSKKSGLNLSAPKQVTWIVALIAGILGLLAEYGGLALGVSSFALVAIGFVILVIATIAEGL